MAAALPACSSRGGEHGPKGFSNPKDLYKSLHTGVRLNTHAHLFQCNTKGLTTEHTENFSENRLVLTTSSFPFSDRRTLRVGESTEGDRSSKTGAQSGKHDLQRPLGVGKLASRGVRGAAKRWAARPRGWRGWAPPGILHVTPTWGYRDGCWQPAPGDWGDADTAHLPAWGRADRGERRGASGSGETVGRGLGEAARIGRPDSATSA